MTFQIIIYIYKYIL